jgi:glycosyltransferase involved in cell wall biosynthesis
MEDLVLSTGIAPEKVARIRIGVDFAAFPAQTPEARSAARAALELPGSAFVVGTFQKDGTGWGDGRQPKSIKGPDVLLAALEIVRRSVPELHVLLSGPAREYVRSGLERLGIPYRHRQVPRYREIAQLYAALDAYIVPSRQEGGPKGVLEAMASAVPVVTTRVGQAAELVRDGENGWLVEVDDAQALAAGLARVASRPAGLASVVAAGRETARANSYDTQLPLWREFLAGLVDVP